MSESTQSTSPHTVKWLFGAIAVTIIIIAIPIFLMVTGRLTLTMKTPAQRVVVQTVVCGDKEIARANEFTTTNMTDEQFKELVDSIKTKANYDSDPTCLNIAVQYYLMFSDLEQIQSIYTQIKALSEQGLYPDSRLDNITPLNELSSYLENNIKSESQ